MQSIVSSVERPLNQKVLWKDMKIFTQGENCSNAKNVIDLSLQQATSRYISQHILRRDHIAVIIVASVSHKNTSWNHLRKNSGDRKYQCKICLQSFNKKGSLRLHEKTQHKKKEYQCTICFKHFLDIYHLTRHSKIHTKVKKHRALKPIELLSRKKITHAYQEKNITILVCLSE